MVLYKVKKGKTFYIADPGKGLVKYSLEEFKKHWISTRSDGEEKGIVMFFEPTPAFYEKQIEEQPTMDRSFKFLFGYIKQSPYIIENEGRQEKLISNSIHDLLVELTLAK